MAIPFPAIDPIAFAVGPVLVRWYSLAYLAGFFGGWAMARALIKRSAQNTPTADHIDDLIFWVVIGVILGGRMGYVLFYNVDYYLLHPGDILKTWEGGMSFHGGLLGVATAIIGFALYHRIPVLRLGDIAACAATIGLFFGRIANFINGELFGRVTDAPIGMVFPHGGPDPRHPSQLYEAGAEGLLLFLVLNGLAWFYPAIQKRHGFLFGLFLLGYGVVRFVIEFFREPDVQIGLYDGLLSRDQILCLPMVLIGLFLVLRARKHA
jgi:phosphatidylglycerol:prolipoprotein diacylglycerol transferase